MSRIHFIVPIEPFGKARPRFSNACGHAIAYTPAKTKRGEQLIKTCARQAMGDRYPFERHIPLSVEIVANFSIPKSYTKKRHLDCVNNDELPTKKPDIDNIVKAVLDSMNDAVFWDDCQIVKLNVRKQYVEGDGFLEITCTTLKDD